MSRRRSAPWIHRWSRQLIGSIAIASFGAVRERGTILLVATLILYFVYNKLIGIDRMKLG